MKAAAPLEKLTGEFLGSYMGDERARRISRRYLPSREAIVEILESVLDLMYPGYFGRRDLSSDNLGAHVAHSVAARRAGGKPRPTGQPGAGRLNTGHPGAKRWRPRASSRA